MVRARTRRTSQVRRLGGLHYNSATLPGDRMKTTLKTKPYAMPHFGTHHAVSEANGSRVRDHFILHLKNRRN
jgi:hypothetical protein